MQKSHQDRKRTVSDVCRRTFNSAMTEPTAPRQRATYSIPFKLDLVQRSLQPGACVAQLARQNGIYDNLLFTWRQRYRHLVDAPSDEPQAPTIIRNDIVPVVTAKYSHPVLPALLPLGDRSERNTHLSPLGCDVYEQLELISSAFKVIEKQRPKLVCCRCDHIVQASMPSKPIERSCAGPSLLARIVTAKFAEHTPHYRQSEIYLRQGVELSRATLGRWSDAVSELLEPLWELLRQYVLMPGKVHTDNIPVPVQEPGSIKNDNCLEKRRAANLRV